MSGRNDSNTKWINENKMEKKISRRENYFLLTDNKYCFTPTAKLLSLSQHLNIYWCFIKKNYYPISSTTMSNEQINKNAFIFTQIALKILFFYSSSQIASLVHNRTARDVNSNWTKRYKQNVLFTLRSANLTMLLLLPLFYFSHFFLLFASEKLFFVFILIEEASRYTRRDVCEREREEKKLERENSVPHVIKLVNLFVVDDMKVHKKTARGRS